MPILYRIKLVFQSVLLGCGGIINLAEQTVGDRIAVAAAVDFDGIAAAGSITAAVYIFCLNRAAYPSEFAISDRQSRDGGSGDAVRRCI